MEKKFFKSSPRVGWNILRPKDSRIIVHLHHLTIISMMTSATLRVTSSSVKMKYLYPGNLSLSHFTIMTIKSIVSIRSDEESWPK